MDAEVKVNGGNPVTQPTKAIDNLANAIHNNKKSNRFRITWNYTDKSLQTFGTALYIRDENVIKYQFFIAHLKPDGEHANEQRENVLFTKISDEVLFKLKKACQNKEFLAMYIEEKATKTRETIYPARPTVFS